MKLTTTIDVQLISKANAREHRRVRDQRIIKEREATTFALHLADKLATLSFEQGARVTLSRPYHETPLDDDNIRAAFKAVRDAVAEFLGVDDGEERLHFIYQQTKAVRTGVKQSKPGWKKVKDKETGEVTKVRKVVKNVAAYDTRPTVTIEVMPVQDIDPQVKRVRELEDKLRRVEDRLSHVRSVTSKRGSDYEVRITELEECLRRWENFAYVNETKGQELGPVVSSIVAETRALLAKCVSVDLEALLTSSK